MAEMTLEAMYRGGFFDHVGGGFSRYSTDERWLVPHFEKMLYDNALLLFVYAEAYQHSHRPLYANLACRTVDCVLRELQSGEGGFYCGQDADNQGVEAIWERVQSYRAERTELHKDDKILTARNGLMIAALSKAWLVLREPGYLEAAKRDAAFIRERLTDADGRLLARWRENEAALSAVAPFTRDYPFPDRGDRFYRRQKRLLRHPCG